MNLESRSHESLRVILLGTDPEVVRGGIGRVMPAYRRALELEGLLHAFIPSYHATAPGGKWWVAVKASGRMLRALVGIRRLGMKPLVYGHAGAWPSLVREGALLFLARLFGARTMLQLHSPTVGHYLDRPLSRTLFRTGLRHVHLLATLTPWWKSRLEAANVGNEIVVIPNPLPADLEEAARNERPRQEPAGKGDAAKLTLLSMARLVSGKGVDTVIKALPHLPDTACLTVAGDGPERAGLEQLASSTQVGDRVTFLGWVEGDEKQALLESADVFCLPSRHDSFGMVFVEAMAYGLPIIALRFGAIPDVVPDGEAGFLVETDSPQTLAEAVRRLMDPERRREMGEVGRRTVLKRFSAVEVGKMMREATACHA